MRLIDFMKSKKPLAMLITADEYRRVRPKLVAYYSERELASIDDFVRYTWGERKFLLCNEAEKAGISTPMMLENAVTFVDRIPFRKIDFRNGDSKKPFLVQITETYKRTVVIFAEDQEQAEETANDLCSDDVIEIDCESFTGRQCECIRCVEDQPDREDILGRYQIFGEEDA